jgi:sulfite oxidase
MFGLSHPKPDLIVHSAEPLNAEPPLDRLRAGFVTKTADFYIRSHGNLPDLNADTHKVRVTGKVRQPLDLTVADLKAHFTAKTVTAVMQCAGNRRADMQQVEKTSGDPWAPGAIGNAEWTGAPLTDVLCAAGASEGEHLHVAFEAFDVAENEGAKDAPYAVSIPMAKAMTGDVLLAYAMNGDPSPWNTGPPCGSSCRAMRGSGARSGSARSECRISRQMPSSRRRTTSCSRPTCVRKRRTRPGERRSMKCR